MSSRLVLRRRTLSTLTRNAERERLYAASIDAAQREAFWGGEAQRLHWHRPWRRVLTTSETDPIAARWFEGGETNLAYNMVDRHAAAHPHEPAVHYVSAETGEETTFTYAQLQDEVNQFANVLAALGVGAGDRVLVYCAMVPEAMFAMIACARLGAIHSVVFAGFAAASLATRIDDARPKLVVASDYAARLGKRIALKPILDHAFELARHPPAHLLVCRRPLLARGDALPWRAPRDLDYADLRRATAASAAPPPVAWRASTAASYILYTSGTTGTPKGVERDVGGYGVALTSAMHHTFRHGSRADGTFFSTSDLGWVVGHSFILYGPLLCGLATVLYEGTPIYPDAAAWWRVVEKYRVTSMYSSPTAMRILKRHDEAALRRHDISSLRTLSLAGEPLDEPTLHWIERTLRVRVNDNFWQTETGVPVLAPNPIGAHTLRPTMGWRFKLLDAERREHANAGVLVAVPPLPPGTMTTVYNNDKRFRDTYFVRSAAGETLYNTFDTATYDAAADSFKIGGRTDDVITCAGHRLGSREIEETLQRHAMVAEAAVIGAHDDIKTEVPVAFVVLKHGEFRNAEAALKQLVGDELGPVARPARIYTVDALPKTRSGKVLRRAIKAVVDGKPTGDTTTIEDPTALERIRQLVADDPPHNNSQ
jgi:propionyl-CoA synthetase